MLPSVQHTHYTEVFVDVHRFSYLARFALDAYALPALPRADVDLSLVVEARQEEEMPEQILGAVHFRGFDFKTAPSLPDGFLCAQLPALEL